MQYTILNQYIVRNNTGEVFQIFAERAEVDGEGDLTLFITWAGVHYDIFPKDYWTEAYENGKQIKRTEEIDD